MRAGWKVVHLLSVISPRGAELQKTLAHADKISSTIYPFPPCYETQSRMYDAGVTPLDVNPQVDS